MPSPIAHSTTGIFLAGLAPGNQADDQSLPHRLKRLGLILFLANVADLDFVVQILFGTQFHHTVTHSLVFTVAFAAIFGLVTLAIRGGFFRAFWLGLLIYGSHVILDMLGGGPGVQFLWPISTDFIRMPFNVFPPVHYTRSLIDLSHLRFILFELMYSFVLLALLRFVQRKLRLGIGAQE